MKKILVFLILVAILLLPKLSFAQDVPCNATNTVCGQSAYDTCTQTCQGENASYYCYQASNPNCNGTLLCGSENSRCKVSATPTPTQSSTPVATDCNARTIVCGQNVYDHYTFTCDGQKATYFSYQTNNPNCQGTILCSAEDYKCQTHTVNPTPKSTPTQTINPTPSPSPIVSPSTQPSTAPVIITKITINDKEIVPKVESKLNLHLPISDLTKEQDVPIRILVTYSDNTTEPFIINFHYKPKQEPIPVSDQTQEVKVLVLKYFPLDSSGSQLNENITGMNTALVKMRSYVDNLTQQGLQKLTEGSKFHGYKTNSPAALRYNLLDSKEFLEPIPISINHVPWNQQAFRPDYKKILNDINICDYVDSKGVNQVWLWGYHTKLVEPTESNMSMGKDSQSFWNHGDYGDVSNSEQTNDLPVCQRTYVLYNYNYQRGLGEVLEDHGHHIEAVLRFIDYDLFWNQFVNPHGETSGTNNCGWMHSPPNVTDQDQYNWTSNFKVLSACEDWKPLDDGAVAKSIDCSEWGCTNDTGANYKVWWMQNLPGVNNGLTYRGENLRNWWVFIGDFDSAIASGKSLTAISHKFTVQSVKTSTAPQSDNNYVPPASLPHPSYPPDISIPSPLPTAQPTPTPLKLKDFNNDGVINIFDYIIYAQKKLGK